MAVNFFLANKNCEKSSIDVIVRFNGKRYKRTAGISVDTKFWNNGWCREVMEYPHGKTVNRRLKKIHDACNDACDYFLEDINLPEEKEFWEQVDLIMTGCAKKKLSFVEFMAFYIEDLKKIMKRNSVKSFESSLHVLMQYEQTKGVKLYFKNFDLKFYNSLKAFMGEKGYTLNYFGTVIKKLKRTYNDAREVYKLHNFDKAKKFKSTEHTADTISLDEGEILKIHRLHITPELTKEHFPNIRPCEIEKKIKACDVARKKFLAGYCTALRISDVQKMTEINIDRNEVKIYTTKTEKPIIIPLHWILREVLESGFDLQTKMADQNINERIKDVCKMAGINKIVQICRKEVAKTIIKSVPKYEAVSTHTARRSGATNMYKSGIPTLSCMRITGHSTEEDFFKYIKIDEEENARILASHSFFNKKEETNESIDDKISALQSEFNLSPEELIKKLIENAAKSMINK